MTGSSGCNDVKPHPFARTYDSLYNFPGIRNTTVADDGFCPVASSRHPAKPAAGCPLAAPSANASGTISPTRAEHVLASLGGRIPMILDGGPTERGLESTIVAVEEDGVRLLRPGPVSL